MFVGPAARVKHRANVIGAPKTQISNSAIDVPVEDSCLLLLFPLYPAGWKFDSRHPAKY